MIDTGPLMEASTGIAGHRAELVAFAAEVTFCSLTYGQLLQHWSGLPDLADRAVALTARL